jgi:TPR repeat protein
MAEDNFEIGRNLIHVGNYSKATEYLLKVNTPQSKYSLSFCYLHLYKYDLCKKYAEEAIVEGHRRAHWILGILYLDGFGVLKDSSKALEYFNLSEDCAGKFNGLGGYYFDKSDSKQSLENYLRSFNMGNIDCMFIIGLCYKYLEDYRNAIEWFNKCINNNFRKDNAIFEIKFCQDQLKIK